MLSYSVRIIITPMQAKPTKANDLSVDDASPVAVAGPELDVLATFELLPLRVAVAFFVLDCVNESGQVV